MAVRNLSEMERCASFHDEFHVQMDSGLWMCVYCHQRRQHTAAAKALMMRVRLGIEHQSYHVTEGAAIL